MTDTTTTDTTDTTDDARTGDEGNDSHETTPEQEVERLRDELAKARKWETRAKANADAAKELDRVRRESMNDAEKAAATAREEAKAEVLRTYGGKLARAEVRAAAAGRIDDEQLDAVLEHLDLTAFLDDEGDVIASEVSKFVDRLAPKSDDGNSNAPRRARDLGQGARGTSLPLNGDPLERALRDKLGIRG